MAFVWVPGGCFEMGSPPGEAGRDPDESPVHEVCVDGFWMGRTEVTNAQYRQFKANHVNNKYRHFSLNEDDQPAAYVSQNEAKAFAMWLGDQNKGRYRFRLPTEAEWEYACRAQTRTARFWGEDADKACEYGNVADLAAKRELPHWTVNNCDDGYVVAAPVGRYKPNVLGLYDMLGNVFEWVADSYNADAYRHHRRDNPIYTDGGSYGVIRGGCWYSWPAGVRCAGRSDHPAAGLHRDYFLGLRLVRRP